jgi:hypothetical protein
MVTNVIAEDDSMDRHPGSGPANRKWITLSTNVPAVEAQLPQAIDDSQYPATALSTMPGRTNLSLLALPGILQNA